MRKGNKSKHFRGLRILLVAISPLPTYPVLEDLVKTFFQIGNSVSVLLSEFTMLGTCNLPIKIYRLNGLSRLKEGVLKTITGFLKRERYVSEILLTWYRQFDLIIVFQYVCVMPLLISKVLRKKIVVVTGGDPRDIKYSHVNMFTKFFLVHLEWKLTISLADTVVVPTGKLKTYIKKRSVQVAPLRLLDDKFFERYAVKKPYTLRCMTVGYVGRLEGVKGVSTLIEAIKKIAFEDNDVRFLIVGDGSLKCKFEYELKDLISSDRLKIVGWIRNVEEHLNKMKLLILPSRSEGTPSAILEAMACGTPVFATPVGAIPDIIKDGETGFLLESNDPRHIADKIVELLNKPELLEKVSKNAYTWIKENFNKEKTIKTWQKIMKQLKIN